MDPDYNTFSIRCWSWADGAARLVIEHVESGQRVTVPTITAACGWLASWALRAPTSERRHDNCADDCATLRF